MFSDSNIIRLATDKFIPVACDDWYQRRRQDAEGEFFRGVAEQGPRGDSADGTKQGIYCLTAGGRLLAYKNSADPSVMQEVLEQALHRWNELPESITAPGAVAVPELTAEQIDKRYARTPPSNGLIINVYTRVLERDANGVFQKCGDATSGYEGFATAIDHMWLTKADWLALFPPNPAPGTTQDLPSPIAERMIRFHLVDNTRGEPPFWNRSEFRKQSISVSTEKVTRFEISMRISGSIEVRTAEDPSQADRGYSAQLQGVIRFDRAQERITRFDITVIGDHWGQGHFTRGARPGRTPLAVVMQLSPQTGPADLVPPQGMRTVDDYLLFNPQP